MDSVHFTQGRAIYAYTLKIGFAPFVSHLWMTSRAPEHVNLNSSLHCVADNDFVRIFIFSEEDYRFHFAFGLGRA